MTESYNEQDQSSNIAEALTPPFTSGDPSTYLEQANRAQFLLNHGHIDGAREVFETIMSGLAEGPTYQHAVILERIGFCRLLEGQPLQAAGLFQKATELAEKLDPSDGIRALQGVIQSELGEALGAAGFPAEARQAFEAALEIANDLGDVRAEGVDRDHLGLLLLGDGKADEARSHFEAALAIFRDLQQPAPQAVTQQHLALAFEALRQWDEAERHFMDAAAVLKDSGDIVGCARHYADAASMSEQAGRIDKAEALYRGAVEVSRLDTSSIDLRRYIMSLTRLLHRKGGSLSEIREYLEEALVASETSLDPDVWTIYGMLADVIEQQAAIDSASNPASGPAGAVDAQVRSYRHIQQYAPRLMSTLATFGDAPSYGRAVILERVGRCCLMGGRPAPAVILFRQGVEALDLIATDGTSGDAPVDTSGDDSKGLRGVLHSGLGDAFRLAGYATEAFSSYEAALSVAEDLADLRGQVLELTHLATLSAAQGQQDQAIARLRSGLRIARRLGDVDLVAATLHHLGQLGGPHEPDEHDETGEAGRSIGAEAGGSTAAFTIGLREDVTTECAFGTDLLIDVRRAIKLTTLLDAPGLVERAGPLPDDVRPMLVPRVRTALNGAGDLVFYLPPGEPDFEQGLHAIVMRNARREVTVSGDLSSVWTLIRILDGARTVAGILSQIRDADREAVSALLSVLAAYGALDVSGRPTARFIHAATKKGVLPGGGLEGENVLRLATDGNYRSHEGTPRIAVAEDVPAAIGDFHALTRSRRSRRDYNGKPLRREDLDALLHTACGLTGVAPWSDREVKLRSYPSSGALYAVEIYPVVLNVEELAPAVYHYLAADSVLEVVRPDLDVGSFIGASLPIERQMVAGAGAMICLVGQFRRHERKYGEGGYRMMVAEAGHISQNLVLAAAALGLSARPFGGVFDTLVNRNLGLDDEDEQFLLSVLVGHAGDDEKDNDSAQAARPKDNT